MKYTEPRERSAELLRAALAKMGQHDAAFNPLTFAVWYEAMAGINAELDRSLQACLKAEPRLSDATMRRLYEDHIGQTDDVRMTRLSSDFQRVMASVSESASRTGESANAFGHQLEGLSTALQSDAQALVPRLGDTLAGIAEMRRSTDALQQQVTASRREIDRLRDDLNRSREEALLDPLTGILNRNGFDRRVGELLQAAADGESHCLVMFDIDHFKNVNDTHGHVVGDRVIAAVGAVLKQCVGDAGHAAARYGGEEFAVLLRRSSLTDATAFAEAVRVRTKAMKLRNRNTQEVLLTVTISAGVAATCPGDDANGWIARADAALYKSKQSGRDRVTSA